MSRNTKNKNYKRYLELDRLEDNLIGQIKDLGYIELEKPVHYGYNAYLTLREDVVKRDDDVSYMYQHMIDTYSTETWSKTQVFYHKKKGYVINNLPKFREVTPKEYDTYVEWGKKFFSKHTKTGWGGIEREYYLCEIPSNYLVMKIKNSYLTHEKVHDGELESQLAFVKDKKYGLLKGNDFYYERGSYKWFQQHANRADRTYNKRALKKNLNTIFINDSVEHHNYQSQFLEIENHRTPMSEKDFILESDWTDWAGASGWSHDPIEFRYKPRNTGF